jgi:hypothetical protein
MTTKAFIQYVKYAQKFALFYIISEADEYYGEHNCLERILYKKYEDLPLVITDIPQTPISYNELCREFFAFRTKYKTLQGDALLDTPEIKEALSNFVDKVVDGDANWSFVEDTGEHLIQLAETCVILGEFDYAQSCLEKIILVKGGTKVPTTLQNLITILNAKGIIDLSEQKGEAATTK